MLVFALLVGRMYYGERDGEVVWLDENEGCKTFATYAEAEAGRQRWIKSKSKKPHPFTDLVNVVMILRD